MTGDGGVVADGVNVEVLHDDSADAQLHGDGHDLQTRGFPGAACDGGGVKWGCSRRERHPHMRTGGGCAGLVEDRNSS